MAYHSKCRMNQSYSYSSLFIQTFPLVPEILDSVFIARSGNKKNLISFTLLIINCIFAPDCSSFLISFVFLYTGFFGGGSAICNGIVEPSRKFQKIVE